MQILYSHNRVLHVKKRPVRTVWPRRPSPSRHSGAMLPIAVPTGALHGADRPRVPVVADCPLASTASCDPERLRVPPAADRSLPEARAATTTQSKQPCPLSDEASDVPNRRLELISRVFFLPGVCQCRPLPGARVATTTLSKQLCLLSDEASDVPNSRLELAMRVLVLPGARQCRLLPGARVATTTQSKQLCLLSGEASDVPNP